MYIGYDSSVTTPAPAKKTSTWAYVAVAGIILAAQAMLVYVVPPPADTPLKQPLATLPVQFSDWTAIRDNPMEPQAAAVLKADETVNRDYVSTSQHVVANLFIAYFASQQRGRAPHSPQHCMPGSGWEPQSLDTLGVPVPGRPAPIRINRYILTKGLERTTVYYWYQSHKRVIANEYLAKIYLVLDSIRDRRSNTALVRVIVNPGLADRPETSTEDAKRFIAAAFPYLETLMD